VVFENMAFPALFRGANAATVANCERVLSTATYDSAQWMTDAQVHQDRRSRLARAAKQSAHGAHS
jgi:hypothetical protein